MEPTAGHGRRYRVPLLALFFIVTGLAALNAGGHTYAIDNEVQFQTTAALAHLTPKLADVDDYWVTREDGPYRELDGGHTGIVGMGHSVVSLPLYGVSFAVAQFLPEDRRDLFVRTGTFFTNSVIIGLLAVAIAMLCLELGGTIRQSVLVALVYVFGTYALPEAKTYLTELTSALCLVVGVFYALRSRRTGAWLDAALSGAALAFGVVTRASGALFVVIAFVWLGAERLMRDHWRGVLRTWAAFALGGAGPLAMFLLFNWWRFGSPFDIGYPRVPQEYPLLDGLHGLFLTPGKSMFLFAPVIVIGIIGLAVGARRQPWSVALIATMAAANIVLFSRVPYWSGDYAWGPRYQQIILPLLVAPAVLLAGWRAWRPAMAALGALGALLPAFLGSMIYFNVLFVRADTAGIGGGAITDRLDWQPFIRTAELIPAGVRDVFDPDRPDKWDRGAYSSDPFFHYGYFAVQPRIDMWWLWVSPTKGSPVTYLFLLPIAGCLSAGTRLATQSRQAMRRRVEDDVQVPATYTAPTS